MRLFQTLILSLLLAATAHAQYVVASGTHVLLRLVNSINTKRAAPGDRIYLETASPVFVNRKLVIPAGTYVQGIVVQSQRAGRVKGRSSLTVLIDSLTLRNGVARDLKERPSSVDTQGNLDKKEGKITGEGTKASDAAIIAGTAATGAGLGTLVGRSSGAAGKGLGIGAGVGTVAGLIGVLSSRGKDVMLSAGTTMELVLNRDLSFSADELDSR